MHRNTPVKAFYTKTSYGGIIRIRFTGRRLHLPLSRFYGSPVFECIIAQRAVLVNSPVQDLEE